MPRVRLQVKPSGGLFTFTEQHPDAEFSILSAYPTGDQLLVILKAEMDSPEELVEFFEQSTFVYDFEVRHLDNRSIVVGYSPVRAAPNPCYLQCRGTSTIPCADQKRLRYRGNDDLSRAHLTIQKRVRGDGDPIRSPFC